MRIMDSRVVQQEPIVQVHLELTAKEIQRLRAEALHYTMPSSTKHLLKTILETGASQRV